MEKSLYFLHFSVNIKLSKKIKFIYLFLIEIIVQAKLHTILITGPLVCFTGYPPLHFIKLFYVL